MVLLSKIRNILVGWGKALKILPTSEAEQALSSLRMKQCNRCENASVSKILVLIGGRADYNTIFKCNICKCPCKQKTLVVSEHCPIDKW